MTYRTTHGRKLVTIAVGVIAIAGTTARVNAGDVTTGCDAFISPNIPPDGSEVPIGVGGIPQIPADFFGPGSDPFSGTVAVIGVPLGGLFGLDDTIVDRLDGVTFTEENGSCTVDEISCTSCTPGSCGNVNIEVSELSLASVAPITVTYNGGQTPTEFDVAVALSPTQTSDGSMRIVHENAAGGSFFAEMDVFVELTFTEVGNAGNAFVLDTGTIGGYNGESNNCGNSGEWTHAPFGAISEACSGGPFNITRPCDHVGPHPVDKRVPTVSEWGLIVMTLVGLTAGTIVFARRRRVAAA